jgi:hypothetical protein
VRSGPLLIGYDGTRAAEHALREATGPAAHRRALLRDATCPVVVARERADGDGAARS